jgi:cytochrome c oxidase assembly factor CtaG
VEVAFSHWSASWPALACYVLVAGAHLAGYLRARPGISHQRRQQALLFQLGLLIGLLALVSPVGFWSDAYLWVHALQFLLIAIVSAGLIVVGAPWSALRLAVAWHRPSARPATAGGSGPGQPGNRRVPDMDRVPARVPWLLARPTVAVIAALMVWIGWQLPVLYDATVTSSAVALASHVTCLAAGVAFWLQLIGSQPLRPAAAPLRRMALVVATVAVTTVLGMVLVFGNGVLYPVYANHWHHVMTVLDDQQLSGAVLWMGSLPPLITVAIALLVRWLNDEESAELSAGIDRLLTPRKNAWSARAGSR